MSSQKLKNRILLISIFAFVARFPQPSPDRFLRRSG